MGGGSPKNRESALLPQKRHGNAPNLIRNAFPSGYRREDEEGESHELASPASRVTLSIGYKLEKQNESSPVTGSAVTIRSSSLLVGSPRCTSDLRAVAVARRIYSSVEGKPADGGSPTFPCVALSLYLMD